MGRPLRCGGFRLTFLRARRELRGFRSSSPLLTPMLEPIRVLLRGFSRGLPLWVIVGALCAYYQPEAFVWTGWSFRYLLGGFIFDWDPGVSTSPFDLTGQKTIDWMFAITMFAMGTVIDPGSFFPGVNFRNVRAGPFARRHLLPVVLGLLTQFSVMPLAAWSTATRSRFRRRYQVGVHHRRLRAGRHDEQCPDLSRQR